MTILSITFTIVFDFLIIIQQTSYIAIFNIKNFKQVKHSQSEYNL